MPTAWQAVTPRYPTRPSSPTSGPSNGCSCTRLPPRCAVPLHLDFTSVYLSEPGNSEVTGRHAAFGGRRSIPRGRLSGEIFGTDLVEELAELLDLVLLLVRDDDAGL